MKTRLVLTILCGAFQLMAADARAQGFAGFNSGNIVVSRSVYTGTAGTVGFPGTLPNGSAAVADGSYPNVFNNETPDAAFGVTSPIFLDQLTTGGALINSLNVTSAVATQLGANLATSFPSKSELGLNLTPDGSALTFMAYGAAANQLDISNSNTPGHIDISNPVNAQSVLTTQRNVAQINYLGAAQITTTNTYSGNNGRNAVLGANGNYYMVGNAGNNGKSATLVSGTVSGSSGSNTVTLSGASTVANMFVGMPFTGTGFAAGTYVTAINPSTQTLTLSNVASATPSGAYTANEAAFQLTGVNFNSGSTTVTVADTSKLAVSMPLTGTNLSGYVQSITDATHFVVSAAPAGSATGASYTAAIPNSMLSDNTGVQMIQKGLNDTLGSNVTAVTNSTVVGKVNGTYGSATGYQRGYGGVPTDKTGKDDNFRGLLNYNNTIYTTKGSGGNGVNSVFQVNPSGGGYVNAGTGLATAATAGTASVNILPGFASTGTSTHPFGLWFANDTTLYVADEGPGTSTSSDTNAGLEKWTFNGTTWSLAYTLQSGLIGIPYTVTDPNNSNNTVTPTAVGLRNITGKINGDGTVTLFGITATFGSALVDAGADPNQLVSITDNLGASSLPAESFTVLETANYGEVLRGVSLAPAAVPEPSSLALLALAGGGLFGIKRWRRKN